MQSRIPTGKEEVKVSLFADDVILYVKKSQGIHFKKKTSIVNKFSKGQDKTQNILATIWEWNSWNNSIHSTLKKIKMVINLTKEVQYLYSENYKTVLRNCWETFHVHGLEDSMCGTSLVAQWLRIRLPMQGTRVWALVQEDLTCRGATKPVRHNYWAHTPQVLKPMIYNKRSHCNEKPVHHNEE